MANYISASPVMTLPANSHGRDFVLGDLHGCYQLLQDLLGQVNFNPAQDRLFSVGDLVDRGPDSLACLELLKEPWFYAVLGNHEAMLADFFNTYNPNNNQPDQELDCWFNTGKLEELDSEMVARKLIFLNNGGRWVEQYYDQERQQMTREFNLALTRVFLLPRVILVGTGANRFQIVHAELLSSNTTYPTPEVWLDQDIDRWSRGEPIPENTLSRMIWGRTLFRMGDYPSKDPSVQVGLSPTFCGHTIASTVRQALSHICLDTGAFMTQPPYQGNAEGFGLTLYDVQQQSIIEKPHVHDKPEG
ncbi:MAG: metallophosphoesterase [Methylococcales bacterium]